MSVPSTITRIDKAVALIRSAAGTPLSSKHHGTPPLLSVKPQGTTAGGMSLTSLLIGQNVGTVGAYPRTGMQSQGSGQGRGHGQGPGQAPGPGRPTIRSSSVPTRNHSGHSHNTGGSMPIRVPTTATTSATTTGGGGGGAGAAGGGAVTSTNTCTPFRSSNNNNSGSSGKSNNNNSSGGSGSGSDPGLGCSLSTSRSSEPMLSGRLPDHLVITTSLLPLHYLFLPVLTSLHLLLVSTIVYYLYS